MCGSLTGLCEAGPCTAVLQPQCCNRVSVALHNPYSFKLGRQEDAHEYLIALLDAMHESIVASVHPKPPPEVAKTSLIYRVFGGCLQSKVRSARCSAALPVTGPACMHSAGSCMGDVPAPDMQLFSLTFAMPMESSLWMQLSN